MRAPARTGSASAMRESRASRSVQAAASGRPMWAITSLIHRQLSRTVAGRHEYAEGALRPAFVIDERPVPFREGGGGQRSIGS